MKRKEELKLAINALEEQIKPLRKELNNIYKQEEKDVNLKLDQCSSGTNKFELNELIFASIARCNCGAGLAYPQNIGIQGAWYCSNILLGRATKKDQDTSKLHDVFPFAFYEIKSENQPSANGLTTRPNE